MPHLSDPLNPPGLSRRAALIAVAQGHVGDLLDAGAERAVGGIAVRPHAGTFDRPSKGRAGQQGKDKRGDGRA